jgi:Glycosyltransferase family 87
LRLRVPRAVWGLIAAGTALRVVLAFTTDGQPYDIEFLRDLRAALADMPLHVYEVLMGPLDDARWPYPTGFFPVAGLAGAVSGATGLAYTSLIRLPAIVADAVIALIVQDFLARRGAGERARIAATALVALGPSFIVISGYHGQIDSLAILPALAAVAIWDRVQESRRALYAGLLIGAGAAVKTTPAVMLLALLPSVRSPREAATLVGAAAAVPLAALAPWLVTSPDEVAEALRYRGFPGTSGLSIVLQPEFGEQLVRLVEPNAVVELIYERGQLIVVAALVAVTAFVARRRPELGPAERATLIWLAFYIVTPASFFQYLVWGLPFFILAGHLRLALAVQATALVPTVLFYRAPWESESVAIPYAATMIALWALYVLAFARLARAAREPAPA